jgi:hypothetical protein
VTGPARSIEWAALILGFALSLQACADVPEGGPPSDARGGPATEVEESGPQPGTVPLTVDIVGCERVGDSIRTTGVVRNRGQADVRYIDVSLSWADSTGTLVATDVASIVGGETLMSGDSVSFGVATAHPQASRCAEASIFFYEPIP